MIALLLAAAIASPPALVRGHCGVLAPNGTVVDVPHPCKTPPPELRRAGAVTSSMMCFPTRLGKSGKPAVMRCTDGPLRTRRAFAACAAAARVLKAMPSFDDCVAMMLRPR